MALKELPSTSKDSITAEYREKYHASFADTSNPIEQWYDSALFLCATGITAGISDADIGPEVRK